jgi:hypothetical protein
VLQGFDATSLFEVLAPAPTGAITATQDSPAAASTTGTTATEKGISQDHNQRELFYLCIIKFYN